MLEAFKFAMYICGTCAVCLSVARQTFASMQRQRRARSLVAHARSSPFPLATRAGGCSSDRDCLDFQQAGAAAVDYHEPQIY